MKRLVAFILAVSILSACAPRPPEYVYTTDKKLAAKSQVVEKPTSYTRFQSELDNGIAIMVVTVRKFDGSRTCIIAKPSGTDIEEEIKLDCFDSGRFDK